MGLGGHHGLGDVPGGQLQVGQGLEQLGLGLLQQPVDVLGAELGEAGPLLLPVTLCCLHTHTYTHIYIIHIYYNMYIITYITFYIFMQYIHNINNINIYEYRLASFSSQYTHIS